MADDETLHSGYDHTGLTGVGAGPTPASARYVRSAGDYTISSTSFADVDATNLALAITTGAKAVLIGVAVCAQHDTAAASVFLDVTVDGTRVGGTSGVISHRYVNASYPADLSFTWLTPALSAGSHTFKLQAKTSSGNGTLFGNSTTRTLIFYVIEQG